jgi:hypothetical protein
MDELIGRIADKVGIERPMAEKAVGIILDFLRKEAPADKVALMLERMPGATALIEAAKADGGGGLFGSMGGIMGLGAKLMSTGLDMSQIQGVARELIAEARQKVGDDVMRDIGAAIPGLNQFI